MKKDPVNFSGMVAADVLRGDMPIQYWPSGNGGFLLDVRACSERRLSPRSSCLCFLWC
jgi:hypothetical protein